MQTANVTINVGGDKGTQVHKSVTAAEIPVLRAIHGDDAVSNIDPTGEVERSNREELDRLRETYGRATDTENRSHFNTIYPGAGARVFQTLDELGLPEILYKPTARASAAPAAPAVDPLDHDGDGKKGGSKPRKSKKADEPAPAEQPPAKADDTESDGVGEMADGGDTLFQ